MKIFIGTGVIALLVAAVMTCPAHLRQQARDVAAIPPEVQAELSRQLSVFTSVMEGEQPEIETLDSQ
jgi:hypothetical protein